MDLLNKTRWQTQVFIEWTELSSWATNRSAFILVCAWYSMQRASQESSLHYAVQLTIQSARRFENGNHHFPAAKSALPTSLSMNLPPMFPSPSQYHCFCVAAHVASLITTILTFHWHCTCNQCRTHKKYACNNCIPATHIWVNSSTMLIIEWPKLLWLLSMVYDINDWSHLLAVDHNFI